MGTKVCLILAHPFQVLYQFVFIESEISSPFGIYTCHPRSLLDPSTVSANLEGVLVVEEGESLFDPLTVLEEVMTISVQGNKVWHCRILL